MKSIRVVQFGLGPIGQACAKVVLQKSGLELVGAIDIDPKKSGRDIAEICGLKKKIGVPVRADAAHALAEWKPHVVIHTTSSFLEHVESQLETIVCSKAHVVSSTEELFYPFQRNPEFCQRMDSLARQHGVAIVGTGVNPGFAMDILPLCLTSACTSVEKITVVRLADASKRRLPLQKKIGAGLSFEEFRDQQASGLMGHVGLRESALAVMDRLRWPVEEIKESLQPVSAEKKIQTLHVSVEPKHVAGIRQIIRVKSGGKERLVLDLQISVGVEHPHDSIEIVGNPPLSMRIDGGIFGDTATIGLLVNTVPKVIQAQPGLRTLMELPMPYAFLGMK